MTKGRPSERAGATRARLFIALDLPPSARTELARWRDSLVADRDEWRALRDESLHLTLVFLGWRDEALAAPLWELATAAVGGLAAPTLAPTRLVPLPPRRPRLLALELADRAGRAAELQRALSTGLHAAGHYEPEQRPFWPHVTLARVRGRARAPQAPPPPPRGSFTARVITLYRSRLHPSGASYLPIERLELAAAGPPDE